eukprot:6836678-Ditylum_brightwellii.AAC.1
MADQDPPKVPTFSKTNIPLKWCELFKNCLYNIFGVMKVLLSYVMCEDIEVPNESGTDPDKRYNPLSTKRAHGMSGSLLQDLINCTSHTHMLFEQDNATVFTKIE